MNPGSMEISLNMVLLIAMDYLYNRSSKKRTCFSFRDCVITWAKSGIPVDFLQKKKKTYWKGN